MTNQQFLATLEPDQCYAVIEWLLHKWGRQFTSTKNAVILWLNQDYKPEDFERVKNVWGLVI